MVGRGTGQPASGQLAAAVIVADRVAGQHWLRGLGILGQLGTDHTEDEETTAPAIRAQLANLNRDGVPVSGG
jgi:hypothetical protein